MIILASRGPSCHSTDRQRSQVSGLCVTKAKSKEPRCSARGTPCPAYALSGSARAEQARALPRLLSAEAGPAGPAGLSPVNPSGAGACQCATRAASLVRVRGKCLVSSAFGPIASASTQLGVTASVCVHAIRAVLCAQGVWSLAWNDVIAGFIRVYDSPEEARGVALTDRLLAVPEPLTCSASRAEAEASETARASAAARQHVSSRHPLLSRSCSGACASERERATVSL